jgi:hypothetical protein
MRPFVVHISLVGTASRQWRRHVKDLEPELERIGVAMGIDRSDDV